MGSGRSLRIVQTRLHGGRVVRQWSHRVVDVEDSGGDIAFAAPTGRVVGGETVAAAPALDVEGPGGGVLRAAAEWLC